MQLNVYYAITGSFPIYYWNTLLTVKYITLFMISDSASIIDHFSSITQIINHFHSFFFPIFIIWVWNKVFWFICSWFIIFSKLFRVKNIFSNKNVAILRKKLLGFVIFFGDSGQMNDGERQLILYVAWWFITVFWV